MRLGHRRAYAPTSNAAGHDHYEKINSWIYFSFLYKYGAPLDSSSGRRSYAMIASLNLSLFFCQMGITQVGTRTKILDAIREVHKKEWDVASL